MKTYADLTDEQFIELHHLAWNLTFPVSAVVSTYWSNISVWQVRDKYGRMTEFNGVTGDIFRLPHEGVENIWPIASKCHKWGLGYGKISTPTIK